MSNLNRQVPLHDIETKQLQSLGFSIIDLSAKGKKSYDTNVLHRHTFYELFFFAKGSGTHEIDLQNFALESDSVHFVAPSQIHKLILKNATGFVLCFTEEFLGLKPGESLIEAFPFFDSLHTPFFKLKKTKVKEIQLLIDFVNHEYQQAPKENTDLLRHYLNIILLKLKIHFFELPDFKTQNQQPKNRKVTVFKKLINEHYLSHLPVTEYAKLLHVTPNHLNALCNKHEGQKAIELIHTRLILESKRLIYATDLSIKEISYRLNFEDTGYFNRFFKNQTNLTPLQYKEGLLKNR
jgi:AraC family transcriptional regulator, transcriptional activator of pobA